VLKNEVNEAFEILLEEIEEVANDLNEAGAEAFRAGDYDGARQAIEEATRLDEFRTKVRELQKEWLKLLAPQAQKHRKKRHRKTRRLPRGLRTPEDAFRRPILEALVELGGSAPASQVLELVAQKMQAILNPHDWEPLPSGSAIRWRNTAQWCRQSLVREGLMKADSPHGIWEISDQGRKSLSSENV